MFTYRVRVEEKSTGEGDVDRVTYHGVTLLIDTLGAPAGTWYDSVTVAEAGRENPMPDGRLVSPIWVQTYQVGGFSGWNLYLPTRSELDMIREEDVSDGVTSHSQ